LVAEYKPGKDCHKKGIGYVEDVGAGHGGEISRLIKTESSQGNDHAPADNAVDAVMDEKRSEFGRWWRH
jgi:hypothetical protein